MEQEQVCVRLPQNAWDTWREGIKNTEPMLYGTGTVADRGLSYKNAGGKQVGVWESCVDSIDDYQIRLNDQGAKGMVRTYKFALPEDTKFPGRLVITNAYATLSRGWPSPLKMGDTVDLYVWRDGEFVQTAFKKREEGK